VLVRDRCTFLARLLTLRRIVKEIKKNSWTLMLKNNQFNIIDPRNFIHDVTAYFSEDVVMYSANIKEVLCVGETPTDLLDVVVNKFPNKPSKEYQDGFEDGVDSVSDNIETAIEYCDNMIDNFNDTNYGNHSVKYANRLRRDFAGYIKETLRGKYD
jgi:hypothetical protein